MDTNTTTKSTTLPRRPFKSVRPGDSKGGSNGPRGKGGPRRDGGRGSFVREKPEFEQKILTIRRVTRVVAGGRRMSFSVAMAIGDKKGSIGFGIGKAGDTALAITKALRAAKKNLLRLKTTKTFSIPHEVTAKFCSSQVVIRPNKGKGMVAGSTIRDMLILGGIKDVTGKIHSGSKNKLNNAQATMKALAQIAHPHRSLVVTKEEPVIAVAIPVADAE
jgi:small subunit ribosomal protein S5